MSGDKREAAEPVEQDAAKSSDAPAEGSDDVPPRQEGSPDG